jgi:two-component system, OmpR family, alkaline phosphatase synthesis response regulator PhoP
MAKKPTLLLIEDDPIIRDIIKLTLNRINDESHPFEVLAASNGEEGLQYWRQYRPEVILLDILLPFINGLDLLKQVNSEGLLDASAVIMLSALGYKEIVQQALLAGAEDFIVKPFKSDFLVSRVQRAMARHWGLSEQFPKT